MAIIQVASQSPYREERIAPSGGDCKLDDCVVCGAQASIQLTAEGKLKMYSLRHNFYNCLGREGVRRMVAQSKKELAEKRQHSRWED